MRAAQTTNKLKTLKYTGAPNFTWDRFSQELMKLYNELANDKVPVEGRTYVIWDKEIEVAESQREAFRNAARAGEQWNSDNAAVHNLLTLAVGESPAHVYTDMHPGDGAKVFKELRRMYASSRTVWKDRP
jgi:hypothetical protein